MTDISRTALFGRLHPVALRAIETATGFCRLRGNAYVELAHWLHVLVGDARSDVAAIHAAAGIDGARLAADLTAALDRLPRGASAVSDFAPQVEEAIERGWMYASLLFAAPRVRSGHLLFAMLKTPVLRGLLLQLSGEWRHLSADRIGADFAALTAGSDEDDAPADAVPAPAAAGPGGEGADALARYAVDLTARARAGAIDPIVGRDAEIRQVIDVLLRRRQNNPILTGEAGVGKTAIVEGLARRIADGDVPPALATVSLHALDVGLLQAGAGVKGEFEKRLRQIVDAVERSPHPIILFIDEAHTLIGAGGQAGTSDAANLLKPVLARGLVRTIAATTWGEYRQYVEKDPALARRFQPIAVAEPDPAAAADMLRALKAAVEAHHRVTVLDEAVQAAVRLSQRYIPSRQLPDKAVSLLDTAAARVAVSQHATPAPVEDARRRIEALTLERDIAAREAERGYVGAGAGAGAGRVATLDAALAEATHARDALEARWQAERDAVAQVAALRASGGDGLDAAIRAAARVRGEAPMVFGEVDADTVAAVVADWTGIPTGRMVRDELAATLTIEQRLKRRVVGQDSAIAAIARRLRTARAGLGHPDRPVGVFLLCGPSGVGKTETAHALAELLYAGEDSLVTINMSEFQEAHSVSTLKGAPAGYVGFGQGGVLTEAVRRRPYSVVLLDEIEKAHRDVHEMFFQVFDKGYMEDAEGRFIDFRNTLILLTSNVGSELVTALADEAAAEGEPLAGAGVAAALRPALLEVFPPALLGRLVVLPYQPLSPAVLRGIVALQLDRIVRRVADHHAVTLGYDEDAVALIVSRCEEVASGGRMIDAILTNTLLPELSVMLIERQIGGRPLAAIRVGADAAGFTYDVVEVAEVAEAGPRAIEAAA
ncbi:type VI secretion system ATPase TssH [Sphingomonas sp. BK235]|uniref:type VI secretion system ATPase TssH n=1 Tax=Sphingomonas sp. BK235 TaxID=2512131 RepID=UPI001042E992|nr:type VI secretion system ATPase TssH [Sphingomonas sp. BK235]TCP33699.1 type VI secretion system protein VasG [Sphingomonas sp. BK235]